MHSLYRFYDGSDRLLYVGQSLNPFTRLGGHKRSRDMTCVRHVEIEWFDNYAEAIKAEAWAIKRENPEWNIDKPQGQRVLSVTPEYVLTGGPKPMWPKIPADDVQAIADRWHNPDIYTWQAALSEAHQRGHAWVRRHHLNDNIGTRNAPKQKEGS